MSSRGGDAWMQTVERIVQVEKTILHRRGLIATDYCHRPGHDLEHGDHLTIDRFLTELRDLLQPAEPLPMPPRAASPSEPPNSQE